MKNIDLKKLFVFIAIILLVALIVFFIIKSNTKPTKDEEEIAKNISINYIANLTSGFATSYNGLELLYQNDKTTYEDLSTAVILNTAIKYAQDNSIDTSIPDNTITALSEYKEYKNINNFTIYNGKGIRTAIKELFGVDFENNSSINNVSFMYDFYYNQVYDVYLMKRNDVSSIKIAEQSIDYSLIKITKKNKKLITTIAIAYVYNNGTSKIYAQDKLGENIIVEDAKEFPTNKIKEFDTFDITLKETEDGKYVFDNIEKVK